MAATCGGETANVGGSWRVVSKTGIPEAGAPRRMLYRDNVLVDDFVADWRYYAPDCVAYVSARMEAKQRVFAVCGARTPVPVASFESIRWTFAEDGLHRDADFIPISAIRGVAERQPSFAEEWQKKAPAESVLTPQRVAERPGPQALIDAASVGNSAEVDRILRAGVDANSSIEGLTPLIAAASHGHADVIRRLAAGGANINYADPYGSTALMYARRANHGDAVQALLAAGAK